MLIIAIFIKVPNWKQPKYPSTTEWVKIMSVEYYAKIEGINY